MSELPVPVPWCDKTISFERFHYANSRHEFHGFSLIEFVLIRVIRVCSDPEPATERPGGIVCLRTVVTHEDAAVAAITIERAAEFSDGSLDTAALRGAFGPRPCAQWLRWVG